jgi:hypothetical protein
MTNSRRMETARWCARPSDAADLPARKRDRALPRLSIVRRSHDSAADMGEWIIDEADA